MQIALLLQHLPINGVYLQLRRFRVSEYVGGIQVASNKDLMFVDLL